MTFEDQLPVLADDIQCDLDLLRSDGFSYELGADFLEFVFLDRNRFWVPLIRIRAFGDDLFEVVSSAGGRSGSQYNTYEMKRCVKLLAEDVARDETQFDHVDSVKGLGSRLGEKP